MDKCKRSFLAVYQLQVGPCTEDCRGDQQQSSSNPGQREWPCRQQPAEEACLCAAGWSECGRFCAVVFSYSSEQATAEGCLYVASVFDTGAKRWLAEDKWLPARGPTQHFASFSHHLVRNVSFTRLSSPVLAAVLLGASHARQLVVFAPTESWSRVGDAAGAEQLLWAPSMQSIILVDERRLARLSISTQPTADSPPLVWMQPVMSGRVWAVRVAHQSGAVWVSGRSDAGQAYLAAYHGTDLSNLGSWLLDPHACAWPLNISTSELALAVHATGGGQAHSSDHVCVYSLVGEGTLLDELLYTVSAAACPAFSADACLLACLLTGTPQSDVAVLAAATGTPLWRLSAANFWRGLRRVMYVHGVEWASFRAHRLHVRICDANARPADTNQAAMIGAAQF